MKRSFFTIGLACLALGTPALAQSEAEGSSNIAIYGTLNGARDGVDLSQVRVTVNGTPATVESDNSYQVSTAQAPYYRVEITGSGVFDTLQTFGNTELRDRNCACLIVPSIELVAKREGRIELFFAGDTMAGRRFFRDRSISTPPVLTRGNYARELDAVLAPFNPYIESADYASLNLETVLVSEEPSEPSPKKYVFFTPPEIAGAMARAGIDHVSLGNNHTADYGDAALESTITALNGANVAWSGAGMDRDEAEMATQADVGGTPLSLLGFVGWRGNWEPNQVATDEKSGAAWGAKARIRSTIRREKAAGRVPILQLHGSPEYSDQASTTTMSRLKLAVDEGAPAAIGHHPHVVHGITTYKGALIAPSLGNFIFDQTRPQTQTSYALKVWLENGEFLRAEAIPLQVLDFRPVPAVGNMRHAAMSRLAWLSAEMGSNLTPTGGHLALWAEPKAVALGRCRLRPQRSRVALLPICAREGTTPGRNIIARGDFENATFGLARDRFWAVRNARYQFTADAAGNGALSLMPTRAGRGAYLYSRSYLRDVEGTRFTVKARVKTASATEVELRIKTRPRSGDPTTPSVRGVIKGAQSLVGSGEWQDVSFDFTLPSEEGEGAARAFRPILRFTTDRNGPRRPPAITIDDVALVEWASPDKAADPHQAWRWTHVRGTAGPALAAAE